MSRRADGENHWIVAKTWFVDGVAGGTWQSSVSLDGGGIAGKAGRSTSS